jgi:hypothetical protein
MPTVRQSCDRQSLSQPSGCQLPLHKGAKGTKSLTSAASRRDRPTGPAARNRQTFPAAALQSEALLSGKGILDRGRSRIFPPLEGRPGASRLGGVWCCPDEAVRHGRRPAGAGRSRCSAGRFTPSPRLPARPSSPEGDAGAAEPRSTIPQSA